MSDKKQYFRKLNPGDVNVEGRQSNGFTADKKGNVIFYSGLKDSELDYLTEIQNKDDIPLYYGNSYFGVIKSETHNNLNLGNDNYETLNEKVDANKIITNVNTTSKTKPVIIGDSLTPSFHANSKKLKELQPNINSYDKKLWKSGLRVGPKILSGDNKDQSLYQYIEKYPVDAEVTHVFISIGTNDSYLEFKSTPIKGFVELLKQKFPTASNSIYIIRGLYGYAGLTDNGTGYDSRPIPKIKDRMDSYYKLWSNLGVKILKNEVGAVTKHPSTNYPDTMKLIGKEIDDIILNNPVTPPPPKQQPPTSPPVKENTPPPPAPQINQYEVESDFVFLEDEAFELAPTQLTDQIARHVEYKTEEYVLNLESPDNSIPSGPSPTGRSNLPTPPIIRSDNTELVLTYLGHNQGGAGLKSILYYAFTQPSQKIPTPNKFTKDNVNGNMYGFRLNGTKYVTIKYQPWSTNVGSDFIKKYGSDIETSFTPGNFFAYWVDKIKSMSVSAKKKIPKNLYDLFSKLSGEYGVPLDYIITACYIESSFNPNSQNARYKGLFAVSSEEFKKYYSSGNILDIEQNSRVGVQLLKERLKESKPLYTQYQSYFK